MTASVPEVDRQFPSLNAVRAAAALGVVATHTAFDTGVVLEGATGAFLSRLDFGVALFFVLSGFLLSRPFFLARSRGLSRPSYRHFLWKRALRILPLYWVTVVAALLLTPQEGDTGPGTWLQNLTLTQIYSQGLLASGLTQMWSLCTEVLFYLLLPAVVLVLAGRGRWRPGRVLGGLVVLTVGGFVWQVVAASQSDPAAQHYHQWLPGFLPWFCVGMAFALVSVHGPQTASDSRWRKLESLGNDLLGCWLIAGAAFAIACTPLAGPRLILVPTPFEAGWKSLLYTVSAAFLVLPLVFGPEREGLARRVTASPAMVWLGEISYGIFCIHLIVLQWAMGTLGLEEFQGRFQTVFILTVAGTVTLAALSYYVLERPFLRLKNRGPFTPKVATATARPAPASD